MHVGYSAIFQNPDDALSDYEVYRNELRLAELAEPLGFESIWSVEHHFTDYTMCPDVVQFLTYMAGRTERAKLGTMVVVLPWHDPMRVAEKVAMLDNISGGRVILGIGRGLGRVEFEGFRVDMNESRQTVRRVRGVRAGGPRKGLRRVRRRVRQAAPPRPSPCPLPHVPGPHLRRGGVAGIVPHHGEAGGRPPHRAAEAVGRRGTRDRRVPRACTAR